MMIFGHTRSSDASTQVNAAADTLTASLFAGPTESVLVSKLSAYLDGGGSVSDNQTLVGTLHDDTGALLGSTEPSTVDNIDSAGWVDFTFATPIAIEGGADYHLGLLAGPASNAARFYRSGSGSNIYTASDTYSNGAASFSPSSPTTGELAIFATYAPAWTPPFETDDYLANLAYPTAQAVLGAVAADPRTKRRVYASWHGTFLDPTPQGSSVALVQQGGELTDLVGERVLITAGERSTAVYIRSEIDLDLEDDTQISLSRRAWQALSPLADDTLLVTCEVIPQEAD